jgi:hypothetical protein
MAAIFSTRLFITRKYDVTPAGDRAADLLKDAISSDDRRFPPKQPGAEAASDQAATGCLDGARRQSQARLPATIASAHAATALTGSKKQHHGQRPSSDI